MMELFELFKLILTKGYFLIFFLSCFNVLRHFASLVIELQKENGRYVLEKKDLLYLGISLAIIFTTIFTGFKF